MFKQKYFPWTLIALITLFLFIGACNEDSVSSNEEEEMIELSLDQRIAFAQSILKGGNGAPHGPHYNLNIIGVPKDKTANMTGNNGRRIFVKLEGNVKITLTQADSFHVIDANGTDGNGAKFALPNPDPDGDGITWYSVFARALGTPGGGSTMTTCGQDTATGDTVCSTLGAVFVRDKGGSKFQNVSKELLYAYVDLDGDGVPEQYPIFDEALLNYFWDYDNNGLKLLQLRFYEVETTTVGP